MYSPRSQNDKLSPRYLFSPKPVNSPQNQKASSIYFAIDSATNVSKSKLFLNDRTASTEINHSELSSTRVRKGVKLPSIKMLSLLQDSIDTQCSYPSIKNKYSTSPALQLKPERPLSRSISGALTPVRTILWEDSVTPARFEDSVISLSKRVLNPKSYGETGALSRFSRRSKTYDSLAILKTVFSDYEKSVKQQIQLLPKNVRTKTSSRTLSLNHTRAILTILQSTINSMSTTISTIGQQISNNEPYDKEVITNHQVAILGEETIVKKLFYSVQQISRLALKIVESRHSFLEIEEVLKEIVEKAKESGNYELHLYCTKIAAKYFKAWAEMQKALTYFRLFKATANMNKSPINQAKSCKYLGICAQFKQDYKKALSYFIKMLQHSLMCNNESLELLAYDLIGIQYYYLGDLYKAAYFHTKMTRGTFEEQDSNFRKLVAARAMQLEHPMKSYSSKDSKEPLSSDEETDIPLGADYEDFAKNHSASKGMKLNNFYTKLMVNSQLELTFTKQERSTLRKVASNKVLPEHQKSTEITDERNISHLSPNRRMENFAFIKGQGLSSLKTQEVQEVQISKRSLAKILKFMVKFQVNLTHLKTSLSEIMLANLEA